MVGDIYSYVEGVIVHVFMGSSCNGKWDYMVQVHTMELSWMVNEALLPAGIVFPTECFVYTKSNPWRKGIRDTRRIIGRIPRKYIPLFDSFADMMQVPL